MATTDSGTPFQVTHDSLHQATKALPDNVNALGDTRGTLLSRTVPASAFGEVDASSQAGATHTETVQNKADQLTKSQGRLDDIIQNIGQTTDRTAQLDDKQARDQREQAAKLAQAEESGGYRASATIIDDGKNIRITPRDPSWPPFTIPNTVGATQGFSMQDRDWDLRDPGHTSSVESRTSIPFESGRVVTGQELANNPTPGPDQPATPQGTRNNALDILPGMKYVVDGSVNSYLVPSSDPTKYTDMVVNYTADSHLLSPGFILRRGVLAGDGTITLQTYGEGVGWFQHNALSPAWRPMNWGLWELNQRQIENSVLQRLGR
jgi:hypothetical protein